ncbi:MAG TPA: hypothetical protein VL727_24730 [Puia sp.]|nr:hypothetical protein [Puia sp.]
MPDYFLPREKQAVARIINMRWFATGVSVRLIPLVKPGMLPNGGIRQHVYFLNIFFIG